MATLLQCRWNRYICKKLNPIDCYCQSKRAVNPTFAAAPEIAGTTGGSPLPAVEFQILVPHRSVIINSQLAIHYSQYAFDLAKQMT